MKKVLLALAFSLSLVPVGAQTAGVSTLKGSIVDQESGVPIPGATVLVDSTYAALADGKGLFTIPGIPRGEARMQVIFAGYETLERTVNFDRETVDLGTISLHEAPRELEAVVAVGSAAAILQKGDTTQFNAAAYSTNPDADASDLVSKMPGMEIDESGNLQAQGDTVKRVYVNNELFLGDDAMKVLSTLPADLVESIQMFDELPDDVRFSGYDDGRTQRALNVVTRGGRFNRQIEATLPAAYGFETEKDIDGNRTGLYNISPNVLYMSPKFNVNVSGSFYNIGSGGGSGRRGGRGGGFTTNQNLNLNLGRTWDRDNSLMFNYSYGRSEKEDRTRRQEDFLPVDSVFRARTLNRTESGEDTSREHNFGLRGELTKGRHQLNLRSGFSFSDGNNWQDEFSREVRDTLWRVEENGLPPDTMLWSEQQTHTFATEDSWSLNNQLDWTVRLGEKRGRTLNVSGAMQLSGDNSEEIQSGWVQEFKPKTGYVDSLLNYITPSSGQNSSFRGGVSYNEPLTDHLRLNAHYGINYSHSERERLRRNLTTDEIEENTSTLSTTDRLSHSGRVGLTFTLPDRLTATTGVEFLSIRDERDYLLPEDTLKLQQYATLRPNAVLNYRFSRHKTLRLNYSGTPGVPSLDNLSNVIDDRRPNRLQAGNPDLKKSYTHSFNLRYNTTDTSNYNNFNLSVRATLARNTTVTRTIYFTEDTRLPQYGNYLVEAGSNLRIPVNANGTINLRANAGYSFRALKQRVSLEGNYTFGQSPSYIDDQLNKARTNEFGLRLGISDSGLEDIDFRVGSRTSYRLTTYSQTPTKNTETFSQSLDMNFNIVFLKGFFFDTNYSLNYSNRNPSATNYLRAWLGYRFLKRRTAEFRVEINDVFNQTPDFNFNEGTESETRTWSLVRGRYVMARFQYRFNSLQAMANRVGRNSDSSDGGERRFEMERERGMRPEGMPDGAPPMRGNTGGNRGGGMRPGGF